MTDEDRQNDNLMRVQFKIADVQGCLEQLQSQVSGLRSSSLILMDGPELGTCETHWSEIESKTETLGPTIIDLNKELFALVAMIRGVT